MLAASGFLLTGCVERSLLVRTDPVGAKVIVNGVDKGPSPVVIPYVRDGRFDVRVEKEGYESAQEEVVTPTKADALPGLDFFAENVWPGTIRRQTAHDIRMVPLKPPGSSPQEMAYTREELKAMLDRANAFREKAKASVAEPGTPVPTPRTNPAPAANR